MFHRAVTASHRLFFALVPPIVLARQVANAAAWFDDEGAPVAADRLHVTMFILDDRYGVPPSLVAALRGVGSAIAAAPIRLVFDRAGGGERSIALRPSRRIAPLDALHREIGRLCAAAGIEARANYSFSPHMTLGYRDGRPFNTPVTPVAWTARELVLVHSHLGRTRHERLGSWALAAAEPQLDLFG
ncbi:2'-5' RNA ligase family protein [Hephaestia mangrovi]|uniref:2'-5' RNA ligase family protein n=1 Tax=Hephaestia mangrovi TaxID=2873268 RepID=UPI001CA60DED|nr:2'-5' RNA ligase family protein [Hephaestia mangrovi]MBY8828432.1 2'-5' RNA ligase family protein [Hephaestia mangrovi]